MSHAYESSPHVTSAPTARRPNRWLAGGASGGWALRGLLTLGLGLTALLATPAQADESQWSLTYTNRLGSLPNKWCNNEPCRERERAYAVSLWKVCLYRDPSTAKWFKPGEWRAVLASTSSERCEESLHVDMANKRLFVLAPFLYHPGVVQNGLPSISCSGVERLNERIEGCTSAFFTPHPQRYSHKALDGETVWNAIRESRLIDMVTQHADGLARQAERERLERYRSEFELAKRSLGDILSFESRYAQNDPEGLIAQLAPFKRELELQLYRERHASMSTSAEIAQFIQDYQADDPDSRVPEARKRLAAMRIHEQDQTAQRQRELAAQQTQGRLKRLEEMLIACARSTEDAERFIERENEIGRISGFVNSKRMREAGVLIVSCRSSVPRDYQEYRQLGGKKSLGELR